MQDTASHLASDGIAVIVTPDGGSLAARILRKKWWHYRVAHISYFNRSTLELALARSGLEAVAWLRPSWFFPLDYLLLRLGHYVPFVARLASIRLAQSVTIPLNLYDSWLVIAKKRP